MEAFSAIEVVPVRLLFERMWQLRGNVSGYDAAYLALTESLDCGLVTSDARLARMPDVRCETRVALPPSSPIEIP